MAAGDIADQHGNIEPHDFAKYGRLIPSGIVWVNAGQAIKAEQFGWGIIPHKRHRLANGTVLFQVAR